MDIIFRKTKSIFTVVSVAKHEPKRYGTDGELLITSDNIDDARLRQASVVSGMLYNEEKDFSHEEGGKSD